MGQIDKTLVQKARNKHIHKQLNLKLMHDSNYAKWKNKKLKNTTYFQIHLFKAFDHGDIYARTRLVNTFPTEFNPVDRFKKQRNPNEEG